MDVLTLLAALHASALWIPAFSFLPLFQPTYFFSLFLSSGQIDNESPPYGNCKSVFPCYLFISAKRLTAEQ